MGERGRPALRVAQLVLIAGLLATLATSLAQRTRPEVQEWDCPPAPASCARPVLVGGLPLAYVSDHHGISVVGRVVGSSRYHGWDPERREVEIGWTFLARSHWGSRHNAEIKALMLRHAFRAAERVVFRVGAANVRSRRAVERIGAVLEGQERDPAGFDVVRYAIARAAFEHRERGASVAARG